jgi:hypothetical protein
MSTYRFSWAWSFLLVIACASDGGSGGPRRSDGGDGGDGDAGTGDGGGDGDDTGVDAGPLPDAGLCEACTVHEQCGATARCISLTSGENACAAVCNPDIPSCPRGFDCVLNFAAPDVTTCVPIGETCCIDQDADGYGRGVGCLGADCDDADIARSPGSTERCNMVDDDCDGSIDEMADDCRTQACDRVAEDAYAEYPPGSCDSGACSAPAEVACGQYTCDDRGEDGDFCATTCAPEGTDDDSFCIAAAHCDAATCVPDFPNGDACDETSDCGSDHCDNGYCCGDGTCCSTIADCPSSGGIGTFCDDSATCQGTRGDVTCVTNQCGTTMGVPDDSACDGAVEANTCGYFTSVYCTGAVDQPTPACPATCAADSACDTGAHCDTVCIPDLADGDTCDEDSDCTSDHCSGNVCCASGDCCRNPADCPSRYETAPVCDDSASCQGTRDAATCTSFTCGTARDVNDDSACGAGLEALGCGLYPSQFCTGGTDQPAPVCPTGCTADAECDATAHCESSGVLAGTCEADRNDGEACDEESDCRSGHCQNGYCCASGDCCGEASDCPFGTYGEPSVCDSAASCSGRRRDPACNATSQCAVGSFVDDDSGCSGLLASDCGLYPGVSCTSAMAQPNPMCPTSCGTSADCDMGAFCMGGMCQPRGMPGDACMTSGQCNDGLACVDGVCCTSACTGACMACDVAGSRGTCSAIPSGQDPAGECGGFSCAAYYAGFTGDTCYQRSDVPDSAVDCNGLGACEGASLLCPMQAAGSATITCDALCQDPSAGTCSGTTPGTCTNVTPSPSTQMCGVGECQVTRNRCNSGTPVTCVPDPPGTETCNDLDDDCDTRSDEGLSGDAYESNNICGTATVVLPRPPPTDGTPDGIFTSTAGGNPTSTTLTPTIYGGGDVDVFSVTLTENDSTCQCGISFDEDMGVVATLSVPLGAGSYQVCLYESGGGCASGTNCVTVSAGATGSVTEWQDGGCPGNDTGTWFATVRGTGAPGFECAPYTLTLSSTLGCR